MNIRIDPTLPRPGWQDTRFVPCPACEGEGLIRHGWRCEECNGTGEVEETAQPVTLEDLDQIPPLVIPDELPGHARDMLAHLDHGYTRAAEMMADDPARHRGSAAAEAHAALLRLDPRLPFAMDGHKFLTGRGDDAGTAHILHLYITLLTTQARARKTRRVA